MSRIARRAENAQNRFHSKRTHALAASTAVAVEALEVRRLFTTFTVTNTGDNGGVNPAPGAGTGTLRQAIVDSNADTAGANTIDFKIASSGTQTITPAAPLPTISQTVDIDGSSESGFTSNPVIVLKGTSAGGSGLTIQANNSTISNLDIGGFRNSGIDISGASGVEILGNFIGVDATGETAFANGVGLLIEKGSQNDTIGDFPDINVISGNTGDGVEIDGTATGPQTSGNDVDFDLIGTDAQGKASIGNFNGVVIDRGAQNNTLGGIGVLLLSGNVGSNVVIAGTATGPQTTGNSVIDSLIGPDLSGATTLSTGPASQGVLITAGAQNNTIGGSAAGNVISGNAADGIVLAGNRTGPNTTGNLIEGNLIGTDTTGESALGNGQNGVVIEDGAQNNTIGGADSSAQDNTISGNAFAGVEIDGTTSGAQTSGNVVEGNSIGADKMGQASIANGTGVDIAGGAQNNTVGGMINAQSNIISGNTQDGIDVHGTSSGPQTSGNIFQGNSIGVDFTAQNALPNGGDGIRIDQGASTTTVNNFNVIAGNTGNGVDINGGVNNTIAGNDIGNFNDLVAANGGDGILLESGAQNNTIGGTTSGDKNVISGNTGDGIEIDGASTGSQTSENTIEGNFIGIDQFGKVAEPNGINGVVIADGAQNNTIGGAVSGTRNLISGNSASGVALVGTSTGSQTSGNIVEGNTIGPDTTGQISVANGTGIAILGGAQNNVIGGTTGGQVNVISGNTADGIEVDGTAIGPQTTGNTIEGNFIGTNANADDALANGADGIRIDQGAGSMTIGARNVISGNNADGVEIAGSAIGPQTTGVTVEGNLIGTSISGETAIGNTGIGVRIDGGAHGNTIGGTTAATQNVISGNLDGVRIDGTGIGAQTTGNAVEGNLIGTDLTGELGRGNSNDGVLIDQGAQGNTIGGTAKGASNVISANNMGSGVELFGTGTGPQTSSNTVSGNFIGIDEKGATALPNRTGVILLEGASNNTIGGTTAGSANVISGNVLNGVQIDGNPTGSQTVGNTVEGNLIGTDSTGNSPVPNHDGVSILGASGTTVGGSIPGEGNVIAYNPAAGVAVGANSSASTTVNNVVRLNSIFNNGGLGIDLGSDGVTPNKPGINAGPNDDQNYPVLATAIVNNGFTKVQGTINSVANTPLVIDFYANPLQSGDPVEGKTYLGSVGVTTDANGNSIFAATITGAVPLGQLITATATTTHLAPVGDTSEFSAPIEVTGGAVIDTTPPTATLTTAPTIATATTSPYAFTITYNDNVAVSAATIPADTVTVTGPNGFSEIATLATTPSTSNGPTITANYTIAAPMGGFTAADNGQYVVSVSGNSVTDTSGNFLAAAPVGVFIIAIPALVAGGTIGGSVAPAAPSYNLTALGTVDWAHWGRGGSASNFDHDSAGGSRISNVTRVGSGSYGGFTYSSDTVSWTNGTPTATDAGDHGFIWANNALGAGYSFTVPANIASKTLFIYLGGFSAGGTLTAKLSDNSSPVLTLATSGSSNFQDLASITFNAASNGQTLTITYTKTTTIGAASGSVDVMAAWLTGSAAPITASPTISTSPQSQSVPVGTPVTFTAAASGSPTPTVQWEVSTNHGGSFSTLAGQTATTLSLGAATLTENGNEYEAVFTNASGTATTTPATLTVTSNTSTGALSGSTATASPSYNLTTLGTSDWAHWGRAGSAGNFDHDKNGGSQISNVTRVGSGSYGAYQDAARRTVSWTNGTPTTSDSGDHGYIYANNALGAGYSFTVPASTTSHTLFIYLGGYSAGGTLTAHLSDSSAPDFSSVVTGTGNFSNLITINFKSASAGQKLTLTYVKTQTIGAASGSVDLVAAWMQ